MLNEWYRSAQGLLGKNFLFLREILVNKHIVRSRWESWNSRSHLATMMSASLGIKPTHWPSGKRERKQVLDTDFEFLSY